MIVEPSTDALISSPLGMLYIRSVLSTSLPDRIIDVLPSSAKLTSSTARRTGASLTAVTVTVNVCESDSSPSETVAVNDSLPLKS